MAGEPTRLEIGEHNVIREFVTINRATVKGGGCTRWGAMNLIMAVYRHIAHDCRIGDHVIHGECGNAGRACDGRGLGDRWGAVGPGTSLCAL